MSSSFEYLDFSNDGSKKYERKFKPYIRCEICIHSMNIGNKEYIRCCKYGMLSDKLKTCKASEKYEN